ncbi:hypothetical protein NMG60_11004991 [Bertholletia excelsa]
MGNMASSQLSVSFLRQRRGSVSSSTISINIPNPLSGNFSNPVNTLNIRPFHQIHQIRAPHCKFNYSEVGLAILTSVVDEEDETNFSVFPRSKYIVFAQQVKLNSSETIIPSLPCQIRLCSAYNLSFSHSNPPTNTNNTNNNNNNNPFSECIFGCYPCKFPNIYEKERLSALQQPRPIAAFLNICYTCKRKLEGRDIFIYRGDSSFCSEECRLRRSWLTQMFKVLWLTSTLPWLLLAQAPEALSSSWICSTIYLPDKSCGACSFLLAFLGFSFCLKHQLQVSFFPWLLLK